MAFNFPLKPVLRLRQSLEERERLRLGLIVHRINQVNQQSDALDREKTEARSCLVDQLQSGMTAAELRLERSRLASLNQAKKILLGQRANLEQQKNAQQEVLRVAQRSRKTLENLRDHKFEIYRQDSERRAQRVVDDLFGLRLARSERT